MMAAIKAEFRKLFTVRSTYFILAFVMLIAVFFAFYVSGWKIDKVDLLNPNTLANDVTSAISAVSVFAALIATLLVAHEYRYSTIMYTLTSSNSRSKVLLAKILVVSGFAVVFTLVIGVLSPILSVLGVHAHHLHLVPQTFNYGNLLWRGVFFGWGYTMAGLIIATIIRNQVGSIVVLFIAPSTVESLLGLLLKKNVVYLPFTALSHVIGAAMNPAYTIAPGRAALVFSGYLIVALIIAWILFLRRDAN